MVLGALISKSMHWVNGTHFLSSLLNPKEPWCPDEVPLGRCGWSSFWLSEPSYMQVSKSSSPLQETLCCPLYVWWDRHGFHANDGHQWENYKPYTIEFRWQSVPWKDTHLRKKHRSAHPSFVSAKCIGLPRQLPLPTFYKQACEEQRCKASWAILSLPGAASDDLRHLWHSDWTWLTFQERVHCPRVSKTWHGTQRVS